MRKPIFFIIIFIVMLSFVSAQGLIENSFSCNKASGYPGNTVTCTGDYTAERSGEVTVEVCIINKPLTASILLQSTGQCKTGDTFCYHNSVLAQAAGDRKTLTFALKVPREGQSVFVGYGSKYQITKTSVTNCCWNGNTQVACSSLPPYGWSTKYSDFTITAPIICGNGVCDSGESSTSCPQDCTESCPDIIPFIDCIAPNGCSGTQTVCGTQRGECITTFAKCTDGTCQTACVSPNLDVDNDGVIDTLDRCLGTTAGTKVYSDGCSFNQELSRFWWAIAIIGVSLIIIAIKLFMKNKGRRRR